MQSAQVQATTPLSGAGYRQRDPTQGVLHRVIGRNWLTFVRRREEEGRYLPAYVAREFESFFRCGILANGFIRLKCESCEHEKLVPFSCKRRGFCASCGARRMSESAAFLTDWVFPEAPVRQWVLSFPIQLRFWMARDAELLASVLAIVIRSIAGYQRRKAQGQGFAEGESGSVTLVQRFGGSVNLNIHFHILMIEGVYRRGNGSVEYRELEAPTSLEVEAVLSVIQRRVVRHLRRRGLLAGDAEGDRLPAEDLADEPPLLALCQVASVQNRIGLGERAGQRVRRLGSFGLGNEPVLREGTRCASLGGFSLHANTAVDAGERAKLEKLCRYVARPAVAELRLEESRDGSILYRFKKDWSDGTRAVSFTPLELIEKLVALVPHPRVHLTRFHGVLAPHSRLRPQIVPAPPAVLDETEGEERDPRRLNWAELLRRTFQVDLEACPDCGGVVRFVAVTLNPAEIVEILTRLNLPTAVPSFHPPRAPPQERLPIDSYA